MDLHIPQELLSLIGTTALAIPLGIRAYKRSTDAKHLSASAQKTIADAVDKAVGALKTQVASLEERLSDTETKHAECETSLRALRDMSQKDGELLEKFAADIETKDEQIKILRKEVSDIRNDMNAGGGAQHSRRGFHHG